MKKLSPIGKIFFYSLLVSFLLILVLSRNFVIALFVSFPVGFILACFILVLLELNEILTE